MTLTIDLITPDGVVLESTEIPQEYTVEQVTNELVESLNLPYFAAERTVQYALLWVNQNLKLDPAQTLTEAGVNMGDQLKLVSSVPVDPGGGTSSEDIPIPLPPPDAMESTIDVVLAVLDPNKSERETFDLDTRIADLIRIIAKKYKLPARDELSDDLLTYHINSKALARQLEDAQTLRTAGIPQFDRLTVVRDEVAG